MRSSNLIFIAGLIFILLTDTIFWIQLKQYLNKKWQILLYGLHTLFFTCTLILFQYSVSRLKGSRQLFLDRKTDRSVIFILYTETHLYRFQRNRSVITEMLSEDIQTDPFIFGYPGRSTFPDSTI